MFALSAERGGYRYPRIIRYVALESNILAILTPEHNLLQINKEQYDKLTEEDKQSIIKTHTLTTYCYVDRSGVTRMIT